MNRAPSHPSDPLLDRLRAEGRSALRAGRAAEAAGAWRELARRCPGDAEAWGNLAVALGALEALDEALAAGMQAAALEPHVAALHANVGDLLYRLHRLDESAAALERARALQPNDPGILNKLGCIDRAEARYPQAERHFRAALRVAPSFAAARINLGTLLLHLQQREAGVSALAEALALPALRSEERAEAERALEVLRWQDTLQPAIHAALGAGTPEPLAGVLRATPPTLLREDNALLELLETMARHEDAYAQAVTHFPRYPPSAPEVWPAIEAHYAFHRPEHAVAVQDTIALLARSDPEAMRDPGDLDVLRYAQAVRDAALLPLPAGDGPGGEAWIRFWHARLTTHRPELAPGRTKVADNRVNTAPSVRTTSPDAVAGTLRRFFAAVQPRFASGPARAAATYLLLLDVHGFADGNGRLARFVASRELVASGFQPIVLPRANPLVHTLRAARAQRNLGPLLVLFAELAHGAVELVAACGAGSGPPAASRPDRRPGD